MKIKLDLPEDVTLREARGVFERQFIEHTLAMNGGNYSATAKQIGIERTALHRKVRKLNDGRASDKPVPFDKFDFTWPDE
jgi:DNA-binding NtrC family response regulator